ncbi:ABC transporter ATP-binding protein [Pseudaminobacter sp. 19-2017]|uniref:ABC transporter ATP-binding protein n=1 Tax=Pseudaminobacter soli (ex Zhang et al. 2022) TaxID=2831468 RepID=A0A942E7F8_9HYPH|nr:ABC transporter ATP-binding protein [Pseudaminobacter soli]MBS3649827.1 ABC transporter ATP-binding protein [Pseudaminobacter soli]
MIGAGPVLEAKPDRRALVSVQGLVVRYGPITALRGVDLEIGAGECVAIIGPNGAGKTSLVSAIAGLVRPAAGKVVLDGLDVARIGLADVVRSGVALVPEGRNIFGSLTVAENLRLGATPRKDDRIAPDIDEIFQRFPILGQRRSQHAGQLSGGEQQMLAIARAMLSRPRLLMLDEPSLGLAPMVVDGVYELLADIKQQGVALLVVEQNATRAFGLADRVSIFGHGAIQLSGAPDAIAADTNFDAAYFGAAYADRGAPA